MKRSPSLGVVVVLGGLIIAVAGAGPAVAADAADAGAGTGALGIWTTSGGESQIQIAPCGPALCGRIVWLKDPYEKDGTLSRDTKNPVAAKRRRTVLGLTILTGMRPYGAKPGEWRGGRIYDPQSGKTYHADMWLKGADKLRFHGYIGVPLFGETTTWTRAAKTNPLPPRPAKRHAAPAPRKQP